MKTNETELMLAAVSLSLRFYGFSLPYCLLAELRRRFPVVLSFKCWTDCLIRKRVMLSAACIQYTSTSLLQVITYWYLLSNSGTRSGCPSI